MKFLVQADLDNFVTKYLWRVFMNDKTGKGRILTLTWFYCFVFMYIFACIPMYT